MGTEIITIPVAKWIVSWIAEITTLKWNDMNIAGIIIKLG